MQDFISCIHKSVSTTLEKLENIHFDKPSLCVLLNRLWNSKKVSFIFKNGGIFIPNFNLQIGIPYFKFFLLFCRNLKVKCFI